MIEIEIACNSLTSCTHAALAGASRIELFENLHDGGCTPSSGMIHVAAKLHIPTYVMIRPRGGNFNYSLAEIEVMLNDIEVCKKANVKGIVFGCLTHEGHVDVITNQLLLKAWNGPATFHRAIDRSSDIMEAAAKIADMGFERILSSGGANSAPEGIKVLRKLQKEFGKHIHIQPGAGITPENVAVILQETGCRSIHATCKTTQVSNLGTANPIFANSDNETFSEIGLIKQLIKNANQWHIMNN